MNRDRPDILVFGEVLVDRFDDGSTVPGGAPFNVAWNLRALGASPLLVSRVGCDPAGDRITELMTTRGLDMSGLQQDAHHPTGSVRVTVAVGEPRYDILPDQAYDHIAAVPLPGSEGARLLYHGTLALRGDTSRSALDSLRAAAERSLFVDVNLRAPWWQRGAVLGVLRDARWAKLNTEELAALAPAADGTVARAQGLLRECGLAGLVVTDGAHGAAWYDADGSRDVVRPSGTDAVVDTVGAGDAFTAVVLLGLLRDWPRAVTLTRAQDLAGAVVGLRGATTCDPEFYSTFNRKWNAT